MPIEESIRMWNPHMLLPWLALLALPPHGGAPAARLDTCTQLPWPLEGAYVYEVSQMKDLQLFN